MKKTTNRKKLLTYVISAFAVVIIISFIAVMLMRPENPNGENINSVSDGDIVGNHIYHEYDESFIVDADITSTAPEKADVLYAKYYQPSDEKKLWSKVFGTKIPKRQAQDDGDVIYDDGNDFKDGNNYLSISESYIRSRRNPDYIHRKLAIENFTTKYESWRPGDYPNPLIDTMYKKESLSFMTPEEAIEHVYTILSDLNIKVSKEDVEIYAIDHETMQQYQDEQVEKYPYITEAYGDPEETFKETFDDSDDFYILCFTAYLNDIPVTHAEYSWEETRFMYGSNIKVYLSESGIFNFDLDYLYQVESVAETAENFITVQEALDKAYKENVWGVKMTVDEVRFEYAPIPYNSNYGEVKLTPVWTVHTSGTQVNGHELSDVILIDAITGEKFG